MPEQDWYEGWYTDGYFWRSKSPQWEKDIYEADIDSKGDLGFNTCKRIVEEGKKSFWAKKALLACIDLLIHGWRWPYRMDQPCDAKTRIRRFWSKYLFRTMKWLHGKIKWIPAKKHAKFRPCKDMSRDPYIAAIYAIHFLLEDDEKNRLFYYGMINPPWYLYNPKVWAWLKYVKTGKEKYLKRLQWWNRFEPSKKDYVQELNRMMKAVL